MKSSLYQPTDIKNFMITEIETPTTKEKKNKEMRRKERAMEFCESVKMKEEEKDILKELKKEELPDRKEALQIFHNELDFIRYQKAIKESEEKFKFDKDPVDTKVL